MKQFLWIVAIVAKWLLIFAAVGLFLAPGVARWYPNRERGGAIRREAATQSRTDQTAGKENSDGTERK
ncbi:hypothetical protein GC173_04335 [bacterium]|nr:hypothetical protein [bacterium]